MITTKMAKATIARATIAILIAVFRLISIAYVFLARRNPSIIVGWCGPLEHYFMAFSPSSKKMILLG